MHRVRRRRARRCRSTRASCRRARSAPRSSRGIADGKPLIGEVGELVITEPMPSMPLYLWDDPDGERYRESYFDMYPGIWRHGDWIEITERGTAIISGRSDSTINRGGIRMGTGEIYRAVLAIDDGRRRARGRRAARRRGELDAAVRRAARRRGARRGARRTRSRRASAPTARRGTCRTRSSRSTWSRARCRGKVLELPVKRILMGTRPGEGGEPRLAGQPRGAGLLRRVRRLARLSRGRVHGFVRRGA